MDNTVKLYTLEEAHCIINKQKRISRQETIYYIKQKLSGLVLIAISIICPMVLDGDITASIFLLPLGIYIVITKEKVLVENLTKQ